MVNYPGLTESQQQRLPALIKPAVKMSAKFEDSTHQLWRCHTQHGPMVLKLCNHDIIDSSSFWQGMNSLFAVNFPQSLADIGQIYQTLAEKSILAVPEYIASESSSYVLARFLEGDDVDSAQLTDEMVKQLARHIAQLHQEQQSNWGAFNHPEFSAKEWSERLRQTLHLLIESQPIPIPNEIIQQASAQLNSINVGLFSPVMLDLRWDQMLHQQGRLSAIVDMDAFVIAPRELELVLIEYQLTPEQAHIFAESYQIYADMPVLAEQRACYRLLLFLMNSLGETDITKWMNAAIFWK